MDNFIIIYTYPHGLIDAFFPRIIIMFSCGILRFQIINTCVCVSFETDIGRPDRSSRTGYRASLPRRLMLCAFFIRARLHDTGGDVCLPDRVVPTKEEEDGDDDDDDNEREGFRNLATGCFVM